MGALVSQQGLQLPLLLCTLCGAARVHGARVVVCLYTRRCGRYFLSLLSTPVTPSQSRVQLQQRFRILTMYTFDP